MSTYLVLILKGEEECNIQFQSSYHSNLTEKEMSELVDAQKAGIKNSKVGEKKIL